MASPLTILKSVLNLNHNCMHVTDCEEKLLQFIVSAKHLNKLESTFMPSLLNESRIFVRSAGKSAPDTIQNTAQNPPGVPRT